MAKFEKGELVSLNKLGVPHVGGRHSVGAVFRISYREKGVSFYHVKCEEFGRTYILRGHEMDKLHVVPTKEIEWV